MRMRARVRATTTTLWAWGLCVGGFWLGLDADSARIVNNDLFGESGDAIRQLLGLSCVSCGLHVFATHGARHVFPHAAAWIRRGVQVGSLTIAVGALGVALFRVA